MKIEIETDSKVDIVALQEVVGKAQITIVPGGEPKPIIRRKRQAKEPKPEQASLQA